MKKFENGKEGWKDDRPTGSNGNSGRTKADLDISLFALSLSVRPSVLARSLSISEFEVHKNARNERGLGEERNKNENKVRMWRERGGSFGVSLMAGRPLQLVRTVR